eukprot:9132731-Prorocentrum_lima.AAC.1
MTSSLVGSEMCIRDRSKTTCGSICRSGRYHALYCDLSKPMAVTRGIIAVSYTHLTLPTICSV